MKKIYHIFLIAGALVFSVPSCIRDNLDDCVPPCRQSVYLTFECINRERIFKEVTEDLELLFYDSEGRLVYNYNYTMEELEKAGWVVLLQDELPGHYTLVAHANYADEHFDVRGRTQKGTLQTEIDYDAEREVHYRLANSYHGKIEDLRLDYDHGPYIHKVWMSKNTNHIELRIYFESEDDYNSIVSLDCDIKGKNALYNWDNTAPEHERVMYFPFRSSTYDGERLFTHRTKTMRIWTTADLTMEVDIQAGEYYHADVDIPFVITHTQNDYGEYPYDTDEKLEYHDMFIIEYRIARGFVVTDVTVNGWQLGTSGYRPVRAHKYIKI